MTQSSTIPPAADTEIVCTRAFPVAREDLFEAFCDPRQLAQWWGPKGFTNTIETFDLVPGGDWLYTMHAPNGTDFLNESRFIEIARPERIVFEHLLPVHWFEMTMLFTEEGAGSRLTWRMRFETAAEVLEIGRFITTANQENFDRLAAHLSLAKA